jgi:hypothetical protein
MQALDKLKKLVDENEAALAAADADNMARYTEREIFVARKLQQLAGPSHNYPGDITPLFLVLSQRMNSFGMINWAHMDLWTYLIDDTWPANHLVSDHRQQL